MVSGRAWPGRRATCRPTGRRREAPGDGFPNFRPPPLGFHPRGERDFDGRPLPAPSGGRCRGSRPPWGDPGVARGDRAPPGRPRASSPSRSARRSECSARPRSPASRGSAAAMETRTSIGTSPKRREASFPGRRVDRSMPHRPQSRRNARRPFIMTRIGARRNGGGSTSRILIFLGDLRVDQTSEDLADRLVATLGHGDQGLWHDLRGGGGRSERTSSPDRPLGIEASEPRSRAIIVRLVPDRDSDKASFPCNIASKKAIGEPVREFLSGQGDEGDDKRSQEEGGEEEYRSTIASRRPAGRGAAEGRDRRVGPSGRSARGAPTEPAAAACASARRRARRRRSRGGN